MKEKKNQDFKDNLAFCSFEDQNNINYFNCYYFNKFYDVFSFFLISSASFLIPFILGHPQFLVGVVVNMLLFEASLYLDFKKSMPAILMPSLGALSRNILFGPFTIFLVYMIPFIWIGNSILVFVTKLLHFKFKLNVLFVGAISSLLKFLFLYASALLMFKLGFVPKLFLTTFGINQLLTALAALMIIYPTAFLRRKNFKLVKRV
ncbi:MAG: hypothetical protein ACP5H9_04175 [Candidatus Woesearchaeota archaeon]